MSDRAKKDLEMASAMLEDKDRLIEHLEGQVDNLVEKNDNQRQTIERLQREYQDYIRKTSNEINGWSQAVDQRIRENTTLRTEHDEVLAAMAQVLRTAGVQLGWGDDESLGELEAVSSVISDQAQELKYMLDAVRTQR